MKVLYIGIFSTEGGISKNFIALGNALASKVEIFSVVGDAPNVPSQIIGEKDRLILNINRKKPLSMFFPNYYFELQKYAEDNNIDVVLTISNSPANIMTTLAVKRYPHMAFLHNPFLHDHTRLVAALFESTLNTVFAKYCSKLVLASNVQVEQLNKSEKYSAVRNKLETIYLCTQTNMIFELPSEEETIDVLFFGRIEYYKGLDILFQAMQGCSTKNYNCVVIGKGNIDDATGTHMDIPSNVSFINEYVADEKLAHYINKCKIFVMPYREATGTQIIQTVMSYRKPIIATKVGCFPEYIEDDVTGLLVSPESVSELEQAISCLMQDKEKRKAIGDAGYRVLKTKFSNEIIADQYVKTIKKLCNA